MCRLVRWRIQLFQKLCFTRDFCSKCFLDVNRGICALFGICSFIAWSGATVWSMTQEKICKPCACTKCKPCCSWQVLPPLLLARTPLLFSHIVSTSVGLAKKETLRNQSLFCYAREIGREGIWTDRGWIRPQCGLRAGRTDERRARRTKSLLLRHSKHQFLIQRLVLFFYPITAQKLWWQRVFRHFLEKASRDHRHSDHANRRGRQNRFPRLYFFTPSRLKWRIFEFC